MHGHYDYVATEAATADEAAPAAVEVEDYDGLLEIGQHNGPMVLHVITDAVSREDALPTENINTFVHTFLYARCDRLLLSDFRQSTPLPPTSHPT